MNSITNAASYVYNSLPTIRIDKPQNILRKATSIALPAIALFGSLYAAQGAEAFGLGTIGCVVCLASGGGPICIPPCVLAMVTAPVPGY